jgi:hypothetical protein
MLQSYLLSTKSSISGLSDFSEHVSDITDISTRVSIANTIHISVPPDFIAHDSHFSNLGSLSSYFSLPPSPTQPQSPNTSPSCSVTPPASGTPRNFVWGGGFNKFSNWGQRAERTGIWGQQPPSQGFHTICKWVKPVFLLGCYGCICHGWKFSSVSLKLRNFGGEGLNPLTPHPPQYAATKSKI